MRFLPLCFVALSLSVLAVDIDQSKYLPLHTGDEWTMDVVITSDKGSVIKATARRKIEDSVVLEGKTYYRTRTSMEGLSTPSEYTKLVRKDDSGFYSIEGEVNDAKEQREIMLPLTVGQRWNRIRTGVTINDSVIGVETVVVAGKTYENCYHIRSEIADKGFREDFWEAPNIGGVKSEIVYADGVKMILTLREFKPGKQ
jgi:hypothetical protein